MRAKRLEIACAQRRATSFLVLGDGGVPVLSSSALQLGCKRRAPTHALDMHCCIRSHQPSRVAPISCPSSSHWYAEGMRSCCVQIPTISTGPPPPRNTAVLPCPLPPLVNHSGAVPDFKGFIVPVEAGPPESASIGGPVSAADDPTSQFLTRGFAMRKRVSLEGVTVQVEEPVSCWLWWGLLLPCV